MVLDIFSLGICYVNVFQISFISPRRRKIRSGENRQDSMLCGVFDLSAGIKIRRLHSLQRGKKPPPEGATLLVNT